MRAIQILGSGCANCKKLAENAQKAIEGRDDYKVEKITDLMKMMKMNVIITPALAIDGEILSSGKILSPDEIKELLK